MNLYVISFTKTMQQPEAAYMIYIVSLPKAHAPSSQPTNYFSTFKDTNLILFYLSYYFQII